MIDLGLRVPWPGEAPTAFPLLPVGPNPLTGIHAWVVGDGGEIGVCPPPLVQASMGTRIPCCPTFAKGAPLGGMNRKVYGPNFSRGTPQCSNPYGAGEVCRES